MKLVLGGGARDVVGNSVEEEYDDGCRVVLTSKNPPALGCNCFQKAAQERRWEKPLAGRTAPQQGWEAAVVAAGAFQRLPTRQPADLE